MANPVASIEIIGEPLDGNWIIGHTYHLSIEELDINGNVISPRIGAQKNVGPDPNWNYTHAYGLLTPGNLNLTGGSWTAYYTPTAIGDEAIAATLTTHNHIYQSIILTNNVI